MNTMTLLSACAKGGIATVAKINATGPLKQRLISFGLMKGAEVKMLECALTNSTYEIKVGNMSLALRKEEAELIEVTNVR
ncbi:MAG: FeoA family protein [Sulfuricurvum sp.]|uniref:FeoA family protein n=1 Tax=Sulfuricurvum sp. TaxID=2025608 RepID=UPI00260B2A78|nr:FeoA family protein [Sulfuricurvum sp.]MDD2368171.1 FeoA family protein [Sulfuricurvum sp.]MDD2950106.1 FeoA family protein [Sulfuricurvum sp.]MDD5117121.1 FeoA family protein [Sulfuricurvum sp.]